jgi:diguanylate cyclase (GGDEF)-like protein
MPKGTLLVIEDNQKNMKLVRDLLQIGRYQVFEATDAESGIKLAREHQPDAILMDIKLPGMDGLSATKIIRADAGLKDTAIAALTAHVMQGIEEKARRAGCDEFITKPIDTRSFLDTIAKLLEKSRQPAEFIQQRKAIQIKQGQAERMAKDMRILVVDDENSVRTVMSQVLQDEGFAVTEAANGKQALECMQKDPFSLVITDIVMPEMTGLELLEKIKKHHPETQVIIITSHASLETAITAMRHGAYDYLFKPFKDLDLISAAANRAIEKVRLIAENQKLLLQLKNKNQELKKANETLKNLASRDGLTGLYNHRYFQEYLIFELYRSSRNKDTFSLLFLDLDFFKQYNGILKKSIRKSNVVARYGGEEFVLLLPATSKTNARIVGEKIRRQVESYPFKGRETQPQGKVTISIGISSFPDDGTDRSSLIQCADGAMYRAKDSGRNKVCLWSADQILNV